MKFSTEESDYVKFREIRETPAGDFEAVFETRTVPIGTGENVRAASLSISGWFSEVVTVPASELKDRRKVIECDQGGKATETRKAIKSLGRRLG